MMDRRGHGNKKEGSLATESVKTERSFSEHMRALVSVEPVSCPEGNEPRDTEQRRSPAPKRDSIT